MREAVASGVGAGVSVGSGVGVSTGVGVGGTTVFVGAAGVPVGTGVGVAIGGTGVKVGGGVCVGVGVSDGVAVGEVGVKVGRRVTVGGSDTPVCGFPEKQHANALVNKTAGIPHLNRVLSMAFLRGSDETTPVLWLKHGQV